MVERRGGGGVVRLMEFFRSINPNPSTELIHFIIKNKFY